MITLTVTPGVTWSTGTVANPTNLNATATPLVRLLPAGTITPDYLDVPALTDEMADAVRGRNFLRRCNFWWEDWKQPEGLACPAGVLTENALEWFARPTGGTITVRRTEEAPDSHSTWGVTLVGGTGVTSTDYLTWVPSAIAGSLRQGFLTFSIYVYNPEGTVATVTPVMLAAETPNERATAATLTHSGSAVTCPSGEWTRVTMTFDAGDYTVQSGFYIGIRTAFLNSALLAMTVAQAQLESASAATTFIRPLLPPDSFANIPVMTDAERVNGGAVIVRMGNGDLRLMPAPAALLTPAVIGYNATAGVPEWIDPDGSMLVLSYTGTDQIVTVPVGATTMEIHCWGAGASSNYGRPGGVGGYSWGQFPCTAGVQFAAMVGGPGVFRSSDSAYGFGGASPLGSAGGGLSGLFTGITPIAFTDAARGFLLAGGGGGVSYNYTLPGSTATAGGNGNDAGSEGGMTDFKGFYVSNGQGGGGGYLGGAALGFAARGGTGYRHTGAGPRPISTSGGLVGTVRSTPVIAGQQLIVPGSTGDYYKDAAGQTDRPGLIVIIWNP